MVTLRWAVAEAQYRALHAPLRALGIVVGASAAFVALGRALSSEDE